jgi:membrane fusion protein (multidrug efflux system)
MAGAQLYAAKVALDKARVDYPAQKVSADAAVQSAQAQLQRAEADNRRQQSVAAPATTQQQRDTTSAELRQAQAQLKQAQAQAAQAALVEQNIRQAEAQVAQLEGQAEQARAQLDQAELNLSWTRVVAPSDGWVTRRNVERGNLVQTGSPILSLVEPVTWITANFKEGQLDRMKPGQSVDISVDAYPSLKLKGHVDSIQMGSGARFTAFPAENATGNFVKIVQRVPVKINVDSGLTDGPLPLGISVEPTVHVK